MSIGVLRSAVLGLIAAGSLFFLDAPLRTFGQRWSTQRSRQRLVLLVIELDLYALWAVMVLVLRWNPRLLPPAAEVSLAALGALLAIAGVGLAVWAKLRLGRWFSAAFGVKEGHELVSDGPYAVTRHPIYTGIIATLLGSALLWNSLPTLLLALCMGVALFLHTVHEEALFERHFGDAYRDYQRRVPRLVPLARSRRGTAQDR